MPALQLRLPAYRRTVGGFQLAHATWPGQPGDNPRGVETARPPEAAWHECVAVRPAGSRKREGVRGESLAYTGLGGLRGRRLAHGFRPSLQQARRPGCRAIGVTRHPDPRAQLGCPGSERDAGKRVPRVRSAAQVGRDAGERNRPGVGSSPEGRLDRQTLARTPSVSRVRGEHRRYERSVSSRTRAGPSSRTTTGLIRPTSPSTHSRKFVRKILHTKPSGYRRDLVRRSAAGAAPAHARSGDRVQIASSLGKSERFDGAIADFA